MIKKIVSRLIAAGLFLSLNFLPLPIGNIINSNFSTVAYAATSTSLPANTKDGAILHAFDWSFNNIKNELPNIAAAGL